MVCLHSAGERGGVERDAAVDPAGSQHAGVPHLCPAAHQRPGERRVPALLLQTGVQPERLRTDRFPDTGLKQRH